MASRPRTVPFHNCFHAPLLTLLCSKKMYKKHIKAWGFEKNIKTAEMIAMIKIRELRRSKNKETLFIRRGRPVEPGKLRRFEKRHKLAEQGTAGTMSDQQGTPRPPTASIPMY